jgi:hypothetical protein
VSEIQRKGGDGSIYSRREGDHLIKDGFRRTLLLRLIELYQGLIAKNDRS